MEPHTTNTETSFLDCFFYFCPLWMVLILPGEVSHLILPKHVGNFFYHPAFCWTVAVQTHTTHHPQHSWWDCESLRIFWRLRTSAREFCPLSLLFSCCSFHILFVCSHSLCLFPPAESYFFSGGYSPHKDHSKFIWSNPKSAAAPPPHHCFKVPCNPDVQVHEINPRK